jgi:spore coat polysaccharide biosynthesis predicted glycosyltransferase SpsG
MEKKSILFRTSGGKSSKRELGLGHIFRCINLAKMLKKNNIEFLIEDFGTVKKKLNDNGFKKISTVKPEINLIEDIDSTISLIKKNKIDIVIVDKYKTKKQYISQIKKIVPVVYISDLFLVKYPSNLLVNGFIGFKNEMIRNENQTMLLGPNFQILDPRFQESIKELEKYDILATFGGIDESKNFEFFLESIEKISKKLNVKCILGSGTKKSKKIIKFQKKSYHNIKIIQHSNNMKKEIASCKFGFCSGGITSYEFALMRKPFAIISQNKHQLITAREWEKKKIAINIGQANKKNAKKLHDILEKISENNIPKFSNKKFVDGKGAQRIAKKIMKILN